MKRFVIVCLVVALITPLLLAETEESQEDRIRRIEAENKALRATMRQLVEENEALKTENQTLAEEVKALDRKLDEANVRLEETEETASQSPAPAGPSTSHAPAEPTCPAALPDKWAGFRGLKWGTNIADAPGMVLVEDSGHSKYYRREGDKIAIGGAELKRITYGFYKGRFFFLAIRAHGFSNWTALRDATFATFGKGYQPNEFIKEWAWGAGLPADAKNVSMLLRYNEVAREATLSMSYEPIYDEKRVEEAKEAKEAEKDF